MPAAGHQVLIFTCHEHILRLFQSLKTPTACLPNNAAAELAPVVFDAPAKEKTKRARKAAPVSRKTAARLLPAEPQERHAEEPLEDVAEDAAAEAPWEEASGEDYDDEAEDEEEGWEDDDEDYDEHDSAEAA